METVMVRVVILISEKNGRFWLALVSFCFIALSSFLIPYQILLNKHIWPVMFSITNLLKNRFNEWLNYFNELIDLIIISDCLCITVFYINWIIRTKINQNVLIFNSDFSDENFSKEHPLKISAFDTVTFPSNKFTFR